MIDPEDIKHRCLQVRKADHALTVQPSAAGLAYDYILKLEAQLEKHKWISVDERLPEDGQQVLIYMTGLEVRNSMKVASFFDGGFVAGGFTKYFLHGVVFHWMPLPESPEGE